MIKKEDLMIGDWVICKKGFVTAQQITAIWANGVVTGVKWDFDEIDPVPLTAEILEKNGFVKHAYGFSLQDFKLYGNLPEDNIVYFTITINKKEIRIDYVHQLQHTLRLCGIKKEIIL